MSDEIPRQRIRDIFTRMDELLVLLIQLQKQQIELLKRLGVPGVPVPGVPPEFAITVSSEIFEQIEKQFGAEAARRYRDWVKMLSMLMPIFEIPLRSSRLPPLPTLLALVQTLGYDHHKFTSLSYTTALGKTLIKDLDARLGLSTDILPEQIIVSPTTEARIDFDTVDEEGTIASTVPSILADQSLSSPLHTVAIRYQAVSASGTLKIFMYWR